MAPAYPPEAISGCVRFGVRTIEHGNLIDEETARLCAEKGAYVVPTLATYEALHRHGRDLGFPEVSLQKLDEVREAGQIVDEEAAEFGKWLLARKAVPTIIELQRCMEEPSTGVAQRLADALENSEDPHKRINRT